MKRMSVAEAISASGAKLISGNEFMNFDSVSTDSRKASNGSLFIGLSGENADGSVYAPSAYEAGCRVMLLSNGKAAAEMCKKYPDAAVMTADDTLAAMQRLAKNYLKKCKAKKIGITGSVGKTTTKEMCYTVLSERYKSICNYENFNNHIGVPITAFTVEEDTEIAIFEMGMNHRGEIRPLADIVHPEISIITTVGDSHIGNMGSREAIFQEKMEITAFMNDEDVLIYNADNDMLQLIENTETAWKRLECSENASVGGVKISDIRESSDGIEFFLAYGVEKVEFKLPVHGRHNAWNAALAAACGLCCDISLEESAASLANFKNAGKRLHVIKTENLTVIDDTYNANPESMRAAVSVLAGAGKGRKVAAMADMLELGEGSEAMHSEIIDFACNFGIDVIIAVGKLMSSAASAKAGKREIHCFESKDDFIRAAKNILKKGDTILLKGSHSMHMDEAAVYLKDVGELNE